eukprot:4197443-Amphidinium_carterae.1
MNAWLVSSSLGSEDSCYAKVELGLCSQACECPPAPLDNRSGVHWTCAWRNNGMALTLNQMIQTVQQEIDVLDSELIIVENIPATVLQRCRDEGTRPPFLLRQSDLQSVSRKTSTNAAR